MSRIVILGAGLAGLLALAHLRKKHDVIVLEKNNYGGLLRTEKINGYQFDRTGHLIHSLNKPFKDFLNAMNIEITEKKRNASVYFEDQFIPYPFQLNISYLRSELKHNIIDEVLKLDEEEKTSGLYFTQWVEKKFGKTLAKIFFIPYNKKLLKTDLNNISPSWFMRYMPVPDKMEIIRSLKNVSREIGYNHTFYYPQAGNIQIIVDKMYELLKKHIILNTKIKSIDTEKKQVMCDDTVYDYDRLISTIPFEEFLHLTNEEHNYNIDYVNVYDLNVGVKKGNFPYHWVYYPEDKYPFYRMGCFSNICENVAPKGKMSFYIETSYKNEPPNKDDIIKSVESLGIFKNEDIEIIDEEYLEYAYPVYNKDIKKLRAHQRSFEQKGITFYGRSGSHTYLSMADLFDYQIKF